MFRECRGELQSRRLGLLMPCSALAGRESRLFTIKGNDPRVSGICCTRITGIFIGHQPVFLGRRCQLTAFNERIGQQITRPRHVGIGGELLQQLSVPLRRLEKARLLLLALCERVVVLGEVPQIRLEFPHQGRLVLERTSAPVRLTEAIASHELALAIHHELKEPALGIGSQCLQ